MNATRKRFAVIAANHQLVGGANVGSDRREIVVGAEARVRKAKIEENPQGKAEILPGEPQKISGELVLEDDLVEWE